jgi:RNA polymerase sigma-70 factor (ECF subfamily)
VTSQPKHVSPQQDAASVVHNDVALAARCAAGDRAAQLQLFRDHKTRVHAILYRVLGSNRDVEDLVQDTFLEVFRSIGSFRGQARLGTWISTICSRTAFAHLSRKKPGAVDLDTVPEIPSEAPESDDVAFAREAARRLYAVLEKLDPKHRIAFALHVIDGRKMQEVAELTEATVVATKSRVWRARKEVSRYARRDPFLASYLASQESP